MIQGSECFYLSEPDVKPDNNFDEGNVGILRGYRPLPDIPLLRQYSREMVLGDMPMKYDRTTS